MSDYMGNLSTYFSAGSTGLSRTSSSASSGYGLEMNDFLTLMVTQLQNQSIDQTADTSDMLNQLVMMQMVSALTNMTEASVMSYAASLVGKTVTVGQYDSDGNLEEIVGEVTGTGTMDGSQVIFVNDKYYFMNEIMAVGVLPAPVEPEEGEGSEGESTDQVIDPAQPAEGNGTGETGAVEPDTSEPDTGLES